MEKTFQHLIPGFLKGKLTPFEEKQLFEWAKNNRKQFLEEQNKLEKQLQFGRNTETSKRWKQLHARIQKEEGIAKPKLITILNRNAIKIAASFLIGIIITSLVFSKLSPLREQLQYSQELSIKTPYGAKTHFILPDSSSVWINSGSELSFPSKFGKTRTVSLKGEAYFDVVKDKIPFIVNTDFGNVKVKGTSFNVKAYENETFETTLVRGIVTVHSSGTGKEVTLKPGEQSGIYGKNISVKPVNTEIITSWIKGKLIFNNEPLPSVAHRLERWYNVEIQLDNDKRLSEIWYTGTIEMESFSEVLQLLETTAPIQYTYNDKTRTIHIKHK
ncbi:hypothetical protein MNBD_BACTEROID01-159 [hydrothermal vent metagenome]|uniref:Anti-sigma factor n=1 Tax=hydrothermal vent metagenome TaxID=652676 RepID=A0A3B0UB22_9ZZZZ